MRWARIDDGGTPRYGFVEGDNIELVEGDLFAPGGRLGRSVAVDAAAFLPPVIPRTFYAAGQNYAEHVRAIARAANREPVLPDKPDVGYRAVNALIGHGQPIVKPADSTDAFQYEGELVVVIGRRARNLSERDALGCVFGYTIGNDVSERTWQRIDRTLWRAKNTDTFKPMGPWIETRFDLDVAMTRVRVNGRQVIEFPTNRMIFGVIDYLVEITRYITLHPGDVLWMGTEGHADPIAAGDTVDIEITGIGTLSNPVIAGTGAGG